MYLRIGKEKTYGMNKKQVNPTFRILSALAIIFVVAGHADFGVFDIAGMFPYYSFHVGVFAFVSGYFYREENEANVVNYIKKKMKHLLLPYFIWNLIYGIFATGLRWIGFQIGNPITLKTLLLDPFLGGHQYGLNFASWFVPVLFLIEILNILGRKILDILHLKKEWIIFTASLAVGVATVWLSIGGRVWGYYRHIGCILFLFPIFQAGQLYKKVWEEKIAAIPTAAYFAAVCLLQYVTLLYSKGQVAYSTVWCTGFAHGPIVPYITTFLGIAFWMGIARLLVPLWKEGNLLDTIGKNTFGIMMHHVVGFGVLNTIYFALAKTGRMLVDFDFEMYFASYEYRYLLMGMENGKWLYLIFGIGVSLLIQIFSRIFLLAHR